MEVYKMLNLLNSKLRWLYFKKKYNEINYSPTLDIHLLACLLYPHGTRIKKQEDIYSMYDNTLLLSYKDKSTIYNATVINPSGIYATADILLKEPRQEFQYEDKFNIIEAYEYNVPMEEIINDMSFKKYVFEINDFKIRKCIILRAKNYKENTKLNINDLFDAQDITKQAAPIYEQIKKIAYQDITPIKQTTSKLTASPYIAYIDYSRRNLQEWENGENFEFRNKPEQSSCRILLNNQMHYFTKSRRKGKKVNNNLSQVQFLVNITAYCDTVYIRNCNFEKSHHMEMAKMFPQMANKLCELNKKLYEWKSYSPLPDMPDCLSIFK